MSFEAVWGFDPQEILKTQKAFHNAEEKSSVSEVEPASDRDVEGVNIPFGLSAQVYELRRWFRS